MNGMAKSLIYLIIAVFTLYGCKRTEQANCTCPPTICLQPIDNYTQQEAKQLSKVLEKKFLELFGVEFEFEVLPNKKLSADQMNDTKTRYRADKIINSLKEDAGDNRIMIGLTHKDVSYPYKGKPDWGVLGLSIHGIYACVVSDYRLKNKKRLPALRSYQPDGQHRWHQGFVQERVIRLTYST